MFVAQPGLIVGNRYSLTQVIGRGGMGEVWKAHDRELDTACAVKFILQHLASDRGIRERFAREAKAVARLRSPHVVHILGVGEVENVPYLAMELLDGETLLTRLERINRMHPVVTLKMLEQVAEALGSAHQAGIVHRDLKPDNIWFWSGNKVFVKVLDFGVAKTGMTTESLQTATGALVGTPQYMSPEQALGNRDIDHRSDLWSLAVIAMECLSGKRPFESAGLGDLLMKIVGAAPPPLRELAPDLPANLQEWWAKALARDPRDRYQSAAELVDALRSYLAVFETEGAHAAESARSARLVVSERAVSERVVSERAVSERELPERGVLELVISEHDAVSGRPGGTLRANGSPDALAARSAPFVSADSLVAESVPPRVPGSVGPVSSKRSLPQRRGSRQRTALIAGGLLVAALLVTGARLFLAGNPREDSVTASPAPAPTQGGSPSTAIESVKPAPSPQESAAPPPTVPAGGERSRLGQPSPWDPVLRGSKPGEPSTPAPAPQTQPGNAGNPASKPPVNVAPLPTESPPGQVGAGPGAAPASPAVGGAVAKPAAGSPKVQGKPSEAAAIKGPNEATRPAPGFGEPATESELAKKERLRKATGL